MRILYFSPRHLWPLHGGAHLRDFYLSRELARFAEVHFLGIRNIEDNGTDPGSKAHFETVTIVPKSRSYTFWKMARGIIGPTPLTILNYADSSAASELSRLLKQTSFDVVQIEGIHLAPYIPIIRSSHSRPRVVCDWHDVESDRMYLYSSYVSSYLRRLYARRTAALLRNAERDLLAACDAHLVVSEREKIKLLELNSAANLNVVENGVDAAHFATEHDESSAPVVAGSRSDLVFVGALDFYANVDGTKYFAGECWPQIAQRYPQLRLLLIGARPAPEVLALKQTARIIVTGTVDDVQSYYRNALAAIVPLRIGGGTRLKILEAMAAGVPVISTPLGAEGLAVTPGHNILFATKPDEMADAVRQLQESPCLWRRLVQAGRELVRARYDWSVIGCSLSAVYRALSKEPLDA